MEGASGHNGCSRVGAELTVRVTKPGRLALSVAASAPDDEELAVESRASGALTVPDPVELPHRSRFHILDLPAGEVTISYSARRELRPAEPEPLSDVDLATYTRPSRYCPSDRMIGIATTDFGGLPDPLAKVRAVTRYVGRRLVYIGGSSRPTDSALDTLLAGEGVCRDFAHLCITFCRGLDIPARFVSVYAPGLSPMDFHAVFEAAVDGYWYVFDATGMAPRRGLTRIATGRDAADTAFLSTLGSELDLLATSVSATADPAPGTDDGAPLVTLG